MLELPLRREARRSLHFLVHILMDYYECLLLYYNYLFKQFYTYTIYYLVSLSSYRSSPIWKCKKRPWVCTPQNSLFSIFSRIKNILSSALQVQYFMAVWYDKVFSFYFTTPPMGEFVHIQNAHNHFAACGRNDWNTKNSPLFVPISFHFSYFWYWHVAQSSTTWF